MTIITVMYTLVEEWIGRWNVAKKQDVEIN